MKEFVVGLAIFLTGMGAGFALGLALAEECLTDACVGCTTDCLDEAK